MLTRGKSSKTLSPVQYCEFVQLLHSIFLERLLHYTSDAFWVSRCTCKRFVTADALPLVDTGGASEASLAIYVIQSTVSTKNR